MSLISLHTVLLVKIF